MNRDRPVLGRADRQARIISDLRRSLSRKDRLIDALERQIAIMWDVPHSSVPQNLIDRLTEAVRQVNAWHDSP
jgi:hypothetical protein